MRSPIAALATLLALTLPALACDNGSAEGDEGSSEPTLEELIVECEEIAECAACPAERQAIENWQAENPTWDESCTKVCVDQCDGGACDVDLCIEDCELERDGIEAEWQAQSDLNFAALRECEDACYDPPSATPGCGIEGAEVLWCPIMIGIDVAAGEPLTCEGRLTEIFG